MNITVPIYAEEKEAVEMGARQITNRTWIGSVQGAVATWSNQGSQKSRGYRMLITDQVATAPCTDPIQE